MEEIGSAESETLKSCRSGAILGDVMSLSSIFVKTVKPILGTPFFTIRRVNVDDFPFKSCPPVMNIDHFWMDKPIFPPHPHAGTLQTSP